MPQKKGVSVGRLSPQEASAIDARLSGKSQREALREAKYSESTIETGSHRFFNRPKIIAAMERALGPAMQAPEILKRVSHKARNSHDEQVQLRALELLGKHRKLFTDKLQVEGQLSLEQLVLAADRKLKAP